MFQKQKESILLLLQTSYYNKDYSKNYWLPYLDFFDTTDDFTDFQCERLEGKEKYISMIEQLLVADKNAQVFVEIYGFEQDNNDIWIYADTIIIYSKLSLHELKQICYKPCDIFPSEIGEIIDLNEKCSIIDKEGNQCLATNLSNHNYHFHYCWWD